MYLGHLCWLIGAFLLNSILATFFYGGSVFKKKKNLPAMGETWVWSLGGEDPLEKEWQPTPVFLPGKSHRQRSLWATVYGVTKKLNTTEHSTYILLLPFYWDWEAGVLSPWWSYFKGMVHRCLRKVFLSCQTCKRLEENLNLKATETEFSITKFFK